MSKHTTGKGTLDSSGVFIRRTNAVIGALVEALEELAGKMQEDVDQVCRPSIEQVQIMLDLARAAIAKAKGK